MNQIDLKKYGPIISDKTAGEEIYKQISLLLKKNEKVEVDLKEIKSMATFCAKQIFGQCYVEIGATKFFENLILKNATDSIKTIIKIGIQNAIEDSTKS